MSHLRIMSCRVLATASGVALIAGGTLYWATGSSAAPVGSGGATRTWVSGVGDDANPCSRTAPCKTFAGAISKTVAGGEINVLDPGGFGAVTITKAITIIAEGVEAGVLANGTSGIIVNAGPADVVVLRGLDIDGAGGGTGINAIRFLAGKALHVENTTINNFTGSGIDVTTAGAAVGLYIDDLTVTDLYADGAAVRVHPTGGKVTGTIDNSHFVNNVRGLWTERDTAITLNNSVIDGCLEGVRSRSTNAAHASAVTLAGNAISHCTTAGIYTTDVGSQVTMDGNRLGGNAQDVMILAGAVVTSFGNNSLPGAGKPNATHALE